MSPQKSQQIVDKILSSEIFSSIDKNALIEKYDITKDIYNFNSKITTCKNAQTQSSLTIDNIPPAGITINTPGTYTFSNNIVWQPNDCCIAITIQCNNVTINLNNYCLTVENTDASKNIIGISIESPDSTTMLDTIEIINGTLYNVGLYGIGAQNTTSLSIENIAIQNIRYKNLETSNVTPSGIHISKAEGVTITNCVVSDLNVTSSSCSGIQLLETKGATLSGCKLSNFVNNDGSAQGYSFVKCESITCTSCSASNFESSYQGITQTLGHTVIGFCPWLCYNLNILDCEATNMTGCCDDCHGMSIFLDMDVTVQNFHAENILDGYKTNTGAKATGLEVYGIGVNITDCTVKNIKAIVPQDLQSTGFSAWGTLINFTNCTATDVQVLDATQKPDTAYGYGTGFGWAPDPRWEFRYIGALWVKYDGCQSNDCQVGFDTWYHIDSTWENNISAKNCGVPILVQPDGKRTLSGNKCSECNPPISTTLTNIARNNTYPKWG